MRIYKIDILKRLLLTIVLLCTFSIGKAQIKAYNRAQKSYSDKKFQNAAQVIDSAITNPETTNAPETWTLRAFIYYELYKVNDKKKLNSNLRDTSIRSLLKSNSLNPSNDLKNNNNKLISTFASGYYNVAKTLLTDSANFYRSELAYNKFKEITKIIEQNKNFKKEDVEYYLAVSSKFNEMYSNDAKDLKSLDIAKATLQKVLEIDAENITANKNLGIIYLNQSTTIVKEIPIDIKLEELGLIQDNSIKLAKQAEQFLLKANKLENNDKNTILGLYYIYRILNEPAKTKEFETKCIQLGINLN
ncbi:MAG: hypothetical protein JSU07_11120 [Bacteroidetes bacterium]|nr:hypothetical protein [Bacteroidota bacterium]